MHWGLSTGTSKTHMTGPKGWGVGTAVFLYNVKIIKTLYKKKGWGYQGGSRLSVLLFLPPGTYTVRRTIAHPSFKPSSGRLMMM